MEELKVTIVTPEGVIFDGTALSATFPGADGEFGVYSNHCSLISLLKTGVLELSIQDREKEYIAIDWGYARIEGDKVDVLVNGAVAVVKNGEIAQNLEKARTLLKKASTDDALLAGALSKLEYFTRS